MSRTKILWKKYYGELMASIKAFLKGDFKKQFPNMLTFSRMLAPIVIIPIALFRLHTLTVIFTILFALTDAFDGYQYAWSIDSRHLVVNVQDVIFRNRQIGINGEHITSVCYHTI